MQILKNKKAQETSRSGEKAIFWAIGVMGIGTMLFFSFYYVMGSYASKEMATASGFETDILVQRFLNSPECFTYYDKELQRPFPGMIVAVSFTEKNLGRCYSVENKRMPAFSLSLKYDTTETGWIKTSNWFGEEFDNRKNYPVLVMDEEGKIKGGMLIVKVQNYR